MLVELEIENFKSIKDKVVFSMLKGSSKELMANTIPLDDKLQEDPLREHALLKSAVLYGANSSGKTNVLTALLVCRDIIRYSTMRGIDTPLPHAPYKLHGKDTSPTYFRVVFIQDMIRYEYEIRYSSERIIDESLFYYPRGRKSLIFERFDTNSYNYNKEKHIQKEAITITSPNSSYLTTYAQKNSKLAKPAYLWFSRRVNNISPDAIDNMLKVTVDYMRNNEKNKAKVLQLLQAADIPITDVQASIEAVTKDSLPSMFPEELKNLLASTKAERYNVVTYHSNDNGENIRFSINEESTGTIKYFSLLGPILASLANDYVLIVDEFDLEMHTLLSYSLIKMLHESTSSMQLVFSTHDVNLLDLTLFRRDQIWFTEMNEARNTDLYSLVEFNQRTDKNIRRGYLSGRYGALPVLGLEDILFDSNRCVDERCKKA